MTIRKTAGPSNRAVAGRIVHLVHHFLSGILTKHVRVSLIDRLQVLGLEMFQLVVDRLVVQRIVPNV